MSKVNADDSVQLQRTSGIQFLPRILLVDFPQCRLPDNKLASFPSNYHVCTCTFGQNRLKTHLVFMIGTLFRSIFVSSVVCFGLSYVANKTKHLGSSVMKRSPVLFKPGDTENSLFGCKIMSCKEKTALRSSPSPKWVTLRY